MSTAVNPAKFIAWTLPALHGALEYFLFDIQANRIHPRFGMTPAAWERRLLLDFGARAHRMVRFDTLFKLLTSPHAKPALRRLDRRRGVFVDGLYFWNDKFAISTCKEQDVEVRTELWNASVIYVCFQGDWLVAQARDGSRIEGRFDYEVELQAREETRRQRSAAAADKGSAAQSVKKVLLFEPKNWDPRLREQCMEEHYLYTRLSMAEALPDAANPRPTEYELGARRSSDLALLRAIQNEPDPTGPGPLEEPVPAGEPVLPTAGVEVKSEEVAATDDFF